jgi:hypothetical protein
MDLNVTFATGRITGEGNDSVGPFVMAGGYDAATKECYWTKTYVAAHDVFYKGFREGKGIWGTWEIVSCHTGGFHIWPLGFEDGEEESASTEYEVPQELTILGAKPALISTRSSPDQCCIRYAPELRR